jgi:hypothetical protein
MSPEIFYNLSYKKKKIKIQTHSSRLIGSWDLVVGDVFFDG